MRFRFTGLARSAVLFVGISLSWFASAARLNAEVVVSTFEDSQVYQGNTLVTQPNVSNQSFAGQPYVPDLNPDPPDYGYQVPTTIRSGNANFVNDGLSKYGSWSGVGFSQKASVTPNGNPIAYYTDGNDFVPAFNSQTGAGAGGSATWGVIYDSGTLAADSGYIFQSLAITNTLWTWDTIRNGDPNNFAGPKFADGDFFTVRFTNTDDTSKVFDFNLADFRNGKQDIVSDWTDVNLSGLNASHLNVSFLGSRQTYDPYSQEYYLATPAYAAIDNVAVSSIAAVPEPSSLALIMAASSAGIWFQWRKRRQSPESEMTPQEIV